MVYKILDNELVAARCPLSHDACDEQCALLVPLLEDFVCALCMPIDTERPIPLLIVKNEGRFL